MVLAAQVVRSRICAVIVVYFGVMPIVGETNMAGQLSVWIDRAIESLRVAPPIR